mmetsp:Transcript_35234/g.80434  ORF Transcript_35234/g.80434 Transcript_35234/m.80434 type:complete len:108 (+) Transcript_35234:32-355(+)|eukprot:CAMPEP_0114557506 /NCGR_PEP_ID=MMETSP0114-20121206/9867_1 /TAXON_ID=31324 /ORGANISM="Goniomonas sp, Strain m" /LENGTH=107 /DNA_ID=CAMNT_0001742799 /DNA_START=26 /DNA_END=349 /DNA_ORIENTATION=+
MENQPLLGAAQPVSRRAVIAGLALTAACLVAALVLITNGPVSLMGNAIDPSYAQEPGNTNYGTWTSWGGSLEAAQANDITNSNPWQDATSTGDFTGGYPNRGRHLGA